MCDIVEKRAGKLFISNESVLIQFLVGFKVVFRIILFSKLILKYIFYKIVSLFVLFLKKIKVMLH